MLAIDAGVKYHGIFLQTEIYTRWLTTSSPMARLPVSSIRRPGLLHASRVLSSCRQKLELYGATSQIFGDKDAGFGNSSEYLVGLNFYPFKYAQSSV